MIVFPTILSRFNKLLKPRKRQNIWQWADENRFLAKGVSAKSQHGDTRYKSSDAPHQRGMLESFTDPEVQTTVLIGASQVMGKTEVYNSVLGYFMDYEPRNCVVMYPIVESSEKYSKKKLMPMIRATPCLDALLPHSRSRDSGNTILVKEYVGGSIFLVGANSTSSLRGASGSVLLADEIDSNGESAGEEGDAVDLLFKRGESFNSVQAVSSTPTLEGQSKIWTWFDSSDQRFWFVPCPHCGVRGIFKWSQQSAIKAGPSFFVEWPEGKTDQCVIVCASCAKSIDDRQRLAMYYDGQWQATAPFNGIRGFHLSWIYCPWPAKRGYKNRLHQMAEEWERAKKKGQASLQVIINTGLSECLKLQLQAAPDWKALFLRLEDYETFIPDEVVYLTCTVDTQADRLEYEIQGWGIGEECFGIETGKIFGNPHEAGVWAKLDELLARTFDHPAGFKLRISCTLIDSGGQSDAKAFAKPVYAYVRRRQGRYVFACKGSSTLGAPLIVGRLQKNGIMLQLVGGDVAKSIIYERLSCATPGPGYCHFPAGPSQAAPDVPIRGYDEEYFQQLTAESVSLVKGFRMWVKRRARNEALDLRVYGHAALELRNVNLEAVSVNLRKSVAPKPALVDSPVGLLDIAQPPQQPPRPTARRRVGFAKWS